MLGTSEAIRQSQQKERREEHRARRCNLITSCVKSSFRSREINGRQIVLKDGKLFVDTITAPESDDAKDDSNNGHPFAGYFLPYPDTDYEGLVSTTTDAAPILNWIYIDKNTHEVKYGIRDQSQPHVTGPFDCTRLDRRMMFEGWEGFAAVEEYPAAWALYFDRSDDGLKDKVPFGTRVLEVELVRREKKLTQEQAREQREEALRAQQEQQQQREQGQGQEEVGVEAESLQQDPQQHQEEDADDEEERTDIISAPRSQTRQSQDSDRDTQNAFDEYDFGLLSLNTDDDMTSSIGYGADTVGMSTDPGASIWSRLDDNAGAGRMSSATYSIFSEDDEVSVAEAFYRENEKIGE